MAGPATAGVRGSPPEQAESAVPRYRRVTLAWTLGAAGLLAYNWWVLVPVKPGMMHSPNELFSNLEVTGRPYAIWMQRADLALIYAFQRNRGLKRRTAVIYRGLVSGAVVAYPLLGAAYLLNRLGGVMESVFFTGFTVMVLTQIADRTLAMVGRGRNLPGREVTVAHIPVGEGR